MPPKKRPYVPKTKGCHQCSRRRIHCDRTEPECQKCTSRGLKCTGLGIRLRFSFRCLATNETPVPSQKFQTSINAFNTEGGPNSSTQWDDELQDGSSSLDNHCPTVDSLPTSCFVATEPWMPKTAQVASDYDNGCWDQGQALVVANVPRQSNIPVQPFAFNIPQELMLDGFNSRQNSLFKYFSKHIASEMIAIDGIHNGWRHILLPFARSNDIVMNSVLTVTSFHISLNSGVGGETQPDRMYHQVIQNLRQLARLDDCSVERKQSVLLTILTLLVGVMVNGRCEFPTLYRMLESALGAIGGRHALGDSEVAVFIMSQIAKFRLYAAPLLSEESGLEIVSSEDHAAQLFDCLTYRAYEYPEHIAAYSVVTDLVQQAIDMYVARARANAILTDTEVLASNARIERFKRTIEAFKSDFPGESVIIWAYYVAAAGCVLDEHKEFFEGVMMRNYLRNGFVNVLSGVSLLREIWSRKSDERWTTLLAGAEILVM